MLSKRPRAPITITATKGYTISFVNTAPITFGYFKTVLMPFLAMSAPMYIQAKYLLVLPTSLSVFQTTLSVTGKDSISIIRPINTAASTGLKTFFQFILTPLEFGSISVGANVQTQTASAMVYAANAKAAISPNMAIVIGAAKNPLLEYALTATCTLSKGFSTLITFAHPKDNIKLMPYTINEHNKKAPTPNTSLLFPPPIEVPIIRGSITLVKITDILSVFSSLISLILYAA